jgi:hypothetical protein
MRLGDGFVGTYSHVHSVKCLCMCEYDMRKECALDTKWYRPVSPMFWNELRQPLAVINGPSSQE